MLPLGKRHEELYHHMFDLAGASQLTSSSRLAGRLIIMQKVLPSHRIRCYLLFSAPCHCFLKNEYKLGITVVRKQDSNSWKTRLQNSTSWKTRLHEFCSSKITCNKSQNNTMYSLPVPLMRRAQARQKRWLQCLYHSLAVSNFKIWPRYTFLK